MSKLPPIPFAATMYGENTPQNQQAAFNHWVADFNKAIETFNKEQETK